MFGHLSNEQYKFKVFSFLKFTLKDFKALYHNSYVLSTTNRFRHCELFVLSFAEGKKHPQTKN